MLFNAKFFIILFSSFSCNLMIITRKKGWGNYFTICVIHIRVSVQLACVNLNKYVNVCLLPIATRKPLCHVVCLSLCHIQRSVRSNWRVSSRWRRRGGRPHLWWETWDRWPMHFLNSPSSSRLSNPPPAHSGKTKCKPSLFSFLHTSTLVMYAGMSSAVTDLCIFCHELL